MRPIASEAYMHAASTTTRCRDVRAACSLRCLHASSFSAWVHNSSWRRGGALYSSFMALRTTIPVHVLPVSTQPATATTTKTRRQAGMQPAGAHVRINNIIRSSIRPRRFRAPMQSPPPGQIMYRAGGWPALSRSPLRSALWSVCVCVRPGAIAIATACMPGKKFGSTRVSQLHWTVAWCQVPKSSTQIFFSRRPCPPVLPSID